MAPAPAVLGGNQLAELPELLRCCDCIMVMKEGCVTAAFDSAEATQEKIMMAAS
jgi:ABC-type sugar transport system ATPase subunit